MRAADAAMYQVKKGGGNRVRVAVCSSAPQDDDHPGPVSSS
jgi:hypothetical protein